MKFSSFDAYCRQSNALDEEAAKRIDEYQAGHKNWMTEGGKGGTFRHRGILLEEGTAHMIARKKIIDEVRKELEPEYP